MTTTTTTAASDLVVLSHLRWVWVWQRPQHLVSRIASMRARSGAHTWFVEEPAVADVDRPTLRTEEHGNVTRVWLAVPERSDGGAALIVDPEYQHAVAAPYGDLLADLLTARRRPAHPDVWVYTPMATHLLPYLNPGRVVYDMMDDLSGFLDAPDGLAERQAALLAEADLMFTGGRSLHRLATRQRDHDLHLFPSGVDTRHYAQAVEARLSRRHDRKPVAGYVGVIDERLDLALLDGLAQALPHWTIQMVGPVTKIDSADLPQRPNIEYLGKREYAELPKFMAGFDVALMPFALNAATRSISPTKTLEYLAAGLPVVSTRVPDVVADYGDLVSLADSPCEFAAACVVALNEDPQELARQSREVLRRQEWDTIAASMMNLLDAVDTNGRSRIARSALPQPRGYSRALESGRSVSA
jgi:glycosyltransferase involved in cell wall biosynthesis